MRARSSAAPSRIWPATGGWPRSAPPPPTRTPPNAPARPGLRSPRASGRTEARRWLDGVMAGTGGILFVTGEAGIGKTRLLQEMRELFESAGAEFGHPSWLEGRCVSYGESLPYWPYRDLLREWLGAGA